MATICDDFPQFSGWPPRKIYFLDNMAFEQDKMGPTYVVVPRERSDTINDTCHICKFRFIMSFNQDLEEWVFNDSKEVNTIVYHYPLCYEVAIGKRG